MFFRKLPGPKNEWNENVLWTIRLVSQAALMALKLSLKNTNLASRLFRLGCQFLVALFIQAFPQHLDILVLRFDSNLKKETSSRVTMKLNIHIRGRWGKEHCLHFRRWRGWAVADVEDGEGNSTLMENTVSFGRRKSRFQDLRKRNSVGRILCQKLSSMVSLLWGVLCIFQWSHCSRVTWP